MKSLEFVSPPAAHGRRTSQRCNERHMFWHAKGKHYFFFFFPEAFYFSGSATLITSLYGKSLQSQVSGERGRVHWFSHTSGSGRSERCFPSVCPGTPRSQVLLGFLALLGIMASPPHLASGQQVIM